MPLSQTRRMVAYIAALVGMFMASLDMQIVATALPTIASDLGNLDLFGWVGAAYLLATAAVTPLYGKLGDQFGRKRVFVVAIALFVAGSLACALAWSMPALIAARVLQGFGGGGLMTSAFAIMADLFDEQERPKYQGYSAAMFTLAGLLGPVAGGILADTIGWRYIFFLNLPFGIAAIVALLWAMPAAAANARNKVDYLGSMLLALAITLAVFWAEQVVGSHERHAFIAFALPVAFAAAVALFIHVEQRAAEPVLPLGMFADPTIRLTLIASVLAGMATLGMLNYFAVFLQTVTGLPPSLAGLLFLPASVGTLIASVASGALVSKTGRYKIYPVVGMAIGTIAMLAFSFTTAATPFWVIGALMFVFSIAFGLQMQTLLVAVQAAAPASDVGAATGAITLARTVGAAFGMAAIGALLNAGLSRGQDHLPADIASQITGPIKDLAPGAIDHLPEAVRHDVIGVYVDAFTSVYYFGAALFAVAFILVAMLKDVQIAPGTKAPAGATA